MLYPRFQEHLSPQVSESPDLAGLRSPTPSGLAPPSAGPWLSPAPVRLEDAQLPAVRRVLRPATPFASKAGVPGRFSVPVAAGPQG